MKHAFEKIPQLFFLITLVTGLFLFTDYGISWDEPIQRELGNANWNYVLHNDDSLFHLINQYHGAFIEIIEILPEKVFHLQNEKTIFLSRHLINYFIFWLGTVFLFLLGKEVLKNYRFALLTVLMLYLTPRIFAQSFYNSKDIPLLSFFIICNYVTLRFLNHPNFILALLLAVVSGMLFAIRIVGIIIPVFTVILFVINLVNNRHSLSQLKYLLVFIILYPLFAILFYPVLWHDPIGGVRESFTLFSHFFYNDPQFFMGKLIHPQEVPWFYIPVWMAITIPPVWQFMFLFGAAALIIFLMKGLKNLFQNVTSELLLLSWLLIPWLTVVFLHSAVYDEWRHLFFIYPAFLLISVYGIKLSMNLQSRRLRILFMTMCGGLVGIQCVYVVFFMLVNHPFENVYFNFLAGKHPEKKFDLDYWGLSYRQGLEYLVEHAKEDTIKAAWQNAPGNFNLIWLNEQERKRIQETSLDSCNYFLTNFRFHPDSYMDSAWYIIRVNFSILAIEKVHEN